MVAPLFFTFGYVKSRLGIALVRATNLCLRGMHMKNYSLNNRRYLWDEMKKVSIVFTTKLLIRSSL